MLRRYVVAAAVRTYLQRPLAGLQEVFLCLQFVLQALQQSDSPGPDLEPCSNSCSAAGFHTALCYVTAARRSPTAGGDDGGGGSRSGNIRTHYCHHCIQVGKSLETYKSRKSRKHLIATLSS